MELLRECDWRAGFELLGRVAEAGDSAPAVARAAVEALPRLVDSEITTLSVCDLASGRRHVIGSPVHAIGAADRATFDRHFRAHPLVRYHADQRGPGAHRISDSVSFVRFREGALYAEYYRAIGIDHAVALPVFVDERRLISFVLNRRGRDFSDRERLMLDVVGTPLAQLYLRAEALDHLRQRVATLEAIVDPRREAPVDGAVARLTPREREVLRWLAGGKTDREIAALLECSHRTVHKHLQRIYVKLGVETRTAAVMRVFGSALH